MDELLESLDVLVVDDSSAVRDVLCNILRGLGVRRHIDEAEDGLAAWKLIQAGDYDIVICDIRMPLMTGLELKELLRATLRFADLPFLIISGEVSKEIMAAAVTSEYDGYLIKPFSVAKLKTEVLKLLARADTASQSINKKKGSSAFLHQVQNDHGFTKMAQACASDEERKAFLRNEGFDLPPEELEAAILSWPVAASGKPVQRTKELRSSQRYDVFLKVTEINGQPATDAIMLDLSMWGARIESLIPLRNNVELNFSLPGEEGEGKTHLSAEVVWWEQVPLSKRYHVGMQFLKSMEGLHEEGEFNLEKFRTAVRKRNKEIADKNFLNIKEFANTLGVHWFTVWRQAAENRIKFKRVKAGCKIHIPASELLKFQGTA